MIRDKKCRDCGKTFRGTVELTCVDCFKKILKRQNAQMKKTMDRALVFFKGATK